MMLYAGGVEEGTITLDPCRNLVDRWVLVEEVDIARAMLAMLEHDNLRAEGKDCMMHHLHNGDFLVSTRRKGIMKLARDDG